MLYIEDLDGLIALVQSSVLEIHPWGSTVTALETPDRMTMDLDPAEDVPWFRDAADRGWPLRREGPVFRRDLSRSRGSRGETVHLQQ